MRLTKITIPFLCFTIAFLCIDVAGAHAQNNYSYNTEKRINTKKTSATLQADDKNEKNKLINVLKGLNKNKGVYFMFSNQLLSNKVVNLVEDMNDNVEVILDKVLKNTGLTYKKINSNTFVILTIKDAEKSTSGAQSLGFANMIAVGDGFTAPDAVITGTVVDKSGNPVPGVTVTVKGKGKGTSTNNSGVFSIEANKGDILVFSSVGYEIQQVTVSDENNIQVALLESNKQLNEVVVTALGIERKAKTLTYATQKVSNADLTTVKDASFVNSLTGKVAGVTITKSASGIGGSTRVIIRGNKSTRENQPLYVVDGVPLVNFSPAQPGDEYGQSLGFVGVDGGDGIANINPDDIESVNVLKGASAAVLYGSKASNGVILITTKKGKAGIPRIELSSEVTFDNPLYEQPLQFKYGQTPVSAGTDPRPGNQDSWGPVVNAPDHVKPFFNTGVTSFNSITLSGGTDKSQTYFSYSYTDNKGMMPTSKLQKHNINFHQTNKFFGDKLSSDLNVLLINQTATNRPVAGLYDNPLIGLYMLPRGIDFNQYKQFETFSILRNTYTQNWWNANTDSAFNGDAGNQNPYWLLNRNKSTNTINRIFTNFSLKYNFNDWLSLQARGNIDKSLNNIDLKSYATTNAVVTPPNGAYFLVEAVNTQYYGDLLLTGHKNLTSDLNLNATIGSSINDAKVNSNTFGTNKSGDGLRYANVFNLLNILPSNLSINQSLRHQQTQAVFADATLGFKNYLYVDLTGRNDWSSTLSYTPSEKKGYFYYSAGINAIVSEMVKMPEAITFGKVRASYAQVGNAIDVYSSNPADFSNDNQNGVNAKTKGVYPNSTLKPEDNRSFEIGTEWRFVHDRIGFDFTFYTNNNYDQYLEVGAPAASGLQTYYLNGGNIRNRGIELSITATPVRTSLVQWNTTINYATNKNEILSLTNDALHVTANSFQLTGIGNLLYASYLVKGGSWGDIYGKFFQRAADGAIIVNDDGVPQKGVDTANKFDNNLKRLGNPNPKYSIGWNNTINIKQFSLNFLFDGRFGGKVMSVTQAVLDGFGYSKASANARDAGGVNINAEKADGTKFTGPIDAKTFYQGVGGQDGIGEYYIYDATNIRLREFAVGYQFKFKKGTVINSLKLSAIGRNLFFITKKAPFDPEVSMSTSNGLQGTDTFGLPTSRSFGFSVKAGF